MTFTMHVGVVASVLRQVTVCAAMLAQLGAQTAIPPPSPTHTDNDQRLEVEFVEVHNLMGIPAQIRRKAGPFILVVANRTPDPTAWFVVDPAPPANAAATAVNLPHVLTIGSAQYERKRRAGVLFSATPGTYQLKNGTTGTVLCSITIN